MNRSLLLGLWATALLWPFVHSGGYADASVLALTPLLLELAENWRHWVLRLIHWGAVLYLQLCLAWGRWASIRYMAAALHQVTHKLATLPPSRWTHISAHLGTPVILIGCLLGWLLFRPCKNYASVLTLLVAGIVLIGLGHAVWGLPAEFPLAAYLIVGMIILISVHHSESGGTGVDIARRPVVNTLAAVVVLVPLAIGFELPARPPVDLANLFPGRLSSFGTTSATTGYGNGVTEIDHSLVPSDAPVFVAHSDVPYYWQAATYNTFNGLGWSNKGRSSTFEQLAGGSDVPILSPYFEGNNVIQVSTTISDASSRPLTNLFYTGDPLKFSVTATVHARSGRIDVNGVRSYRLTALEPLDNPARLRAQRRGSTPRDLAIDLEVPSNLSPKVQQLAQRVAQGLNGTYTIATAIKHYLDSHDRYSYQVGPAAHDIVNEFLFVDRQGYCDQFSTSFIMMMRSLGIPARWVVGYDPGTYVSSRGGYLIRQVDAHSWAEIWINGAGWVPFDPTPGFNFPSYSRSSATSSTKPTITTRTPTTPTAAYTPPSSLNADAHLRKISSPLGPRNVHHPASANVGDDVLGALALLVLVSALVWGWRRHRTANETVRQWVDLQRVSRRSFGASEWESDSPREWGRVWTRRFPSDSALIWPLVRLFEQSFYSKRPLSAQEEAEAKRLWRTLRGRARRLHRSNRVST